MADKNLNEEILSDEELGKVAGGFWQESIRDAQFFNALGIIKQSYSAEDFINCDEKAIGDVRAAFASFGISDETNTDGYSNWYTQILEGDKLKKLTRAEALKIVCDKVRPGFDYSKYLQ